MTPPTTSTLPPSQGVLQMQTNNSDRFPSRKNPRMSSIDYTSPNHYFVTVCTHGKVCIFGNPGQLNHLGQIAADAIANIPNHFPGVRIDKYVVMPNHIHTIIVLDGHDTNLSVVVGLYKSHVTKQIHAIFPNLKVWQSSFHDHVIRNQRSYEKIWNYIEGNPSKWEDDCFYIHEPIN